MQVDVWVELGKLIQGEGQNEPAEISIFIDLAKLLVAPSILICFI